MNLESFTDYSLVNNRVLRVANGQTIPILGVGTVLICDNPRIELPGCLHVPGLQQNGLVSVSHLVAVTDSSVYFDKNGMRITMTGSIVINISPTNGLYVMSQDANCELSSQIDQNLKVDNHGLYCCDCTYYINCLCNYSNYKEITMEHTCSMIKSATDGGKVISDEYAYLSNALSLLHRCYGHLPLVVCINILLYVRLGGRLWTCGFFDNCINMFVPFA
jgi:hypothetical protein